MERGTGYRRSDEHPVDGLDIAEEEMEGIGSGGDIGRVFADEGAIAEEPCRSRVPVDTDHLERGGVGSFPGLGERAAVVGIGIEISVGEELDADIVQAVIGEQGFGIGDAGPSLIGLFGFEPELDGRVEGDGEGGGRDHILGAAGIGRHIEDAGAGGYRFTAMGRPFGGIQGRTREVVEEQERCVTVAQGWRTGVPVIEVDLRPGGRDGGDLYPDGRGVGPGLLDPVAEYRVIRGGEPEIGVVRVDVLPEIDILAGTGAGSPPDPEPDLVIGESP
jgi:hypothetical protein